MNKIRRRCPFCSGYLTEEEGVMIRMPDRTNRLVHPDHPGVADERRRQEEAWGSNPTSP